MVLELSYIDLLKRLYSHQEGTVMTDKESPVFAIRRGTKQGDLVSTLLFNTVLQFASEERFEEMAGKQRHPFE